MNNLNESSKPVVSQVYVSKKSKDNYEDYVMVTSVDGDTVTYINPFRDEVSTTVEMFNKKYKKGSKEDFAVFEDGDNMDMIGKVITINESCYPVVSEGSVRIVCMDEDGDKFSIDKKDLMSSLYESEDLFEAASISVVNKGVDKDGLLLVVNGKDYHYTSDSYTPKQLEDKFVGIAKHSVGKAYTWIKGNAKAKESYKKVKDSPKVDVPSASSYVNGVIKGLKKFPDKYSVKVGGEDLVFKVEKYVEVWGDSSYTGHLDLSPIDKSAIKRSAEKWISGGRTKNRDVGSFVDTLLDGLSKEIVKSDSERKIRTGFWNPSEYKTIDDLEGITHRAYFTNMAYDRSCPSSYKYFGSDTKKFYDYIKPELDKAGIKTVLRK